jgi:hypothetical protein
MTAPRYILAQQPDALFAANCKKASAATVRGDINKLLNDDYSDFEQFHKVMPDDMPWHLAVSTAPCPNEVTGVSIDGKVWLAPYLPPGAAAYIKACTNLAAWSPRKILGFRLSGSVVKAGDTEYGYYKLKEKYSTWEGNALTTEIVAASVATQALQLKALGVPCLSFAILDPESQPDKQWGNALVQAVAAACPTGVAMMDTNLGLHPPSTFVQAAGSITGMMAFQLHATVAGADIANWLAEAENYAPAWVEMRASQLELI